jgi:hypothetical protein
VKVANQSFDQEKQLVTVSIHPYKHYDLVCQRCQR